MRELDDVLRRFMGAIAGRLSASTSRNTRSV